MEDGDSSEEKYREDEGAGTSAQAGEPSEKQENGKEQQCQEHNGPSRQFLKSLCIYSKNDPTGIPSLFHFSL